MPLRPPARLAALGRRVAVAVGRRFARRLAVLPRRQDGVALAQNIMLLGTLIGAGGFAVDAANGLRVETMLQGTADAAALAAAQDLPDGDAARATALAYVEANMPADAHGVVAREEDVELGWWRPEDGGFVPDDGAAGPPPDGALDGVRVTLGRDATRGNPLDALLLGLFGQATLDVTVRSTAQKTRRGRNDAVLGGRALSKALVKLNNTNDFLDDFCVHSRQVVEMSAGNTFEAGVRVTMPDLAELKADPADNPGLADALDEWTYDFPLLPLVSGIIAGMRVDRDGLPSWVTSGPYHVGTMPASPVEGGLYVVSGSVELTGTLPDIAVVADDIKLDGLTMDRAIMATPGVIKIGRDVFIGPANPCGRGQYSGYFLTETALDFNQEVHLGGIQMAASESMKLNGRSTFTGVYIETPGNMTVNTTNDFIGCPNGLASVFVEGSVGPSAGPAGGPKGRAAMR